VGGSLLLRNKYCSEATIIVEQQQVPERYVTPTSTSDLNSALQAMTQEVLSRAHLLQIIDQFDLYEKERRRLGPEELVRLMRQDIEIRPLEGDPQRRNINSFRISFSTDSPRLAQQVTIRLTILYIEQNVKTREQQALGTTAFLGNQLGAARTELQKEETRVRDFKMQHLGELPEQEQGNLQILAGLQTQLQNTVSGLARAQEQRTYLVSLLNQYAESYRALPGEPIANPVEAERQRLAQLHAQRSELLSKYLPGHPDILKIDREIAQSKTLLDQAQRATTAVTPEAKEDKNASSFKGDTATAQIRSQLEANRLEMENLGKDQKRLEGQIKMYEQRINVTPVREQQYTEAVRDYTLSKQNYEDLLGKKTQSELASSLERQQQGQQFRIVDSASLPAKPASPDRFRISLGGLAAGLALALGLLMFLEVRRASFHTESEVRSRYALPIVLGIPSLPTPAELKSRSISLAFEWVGGIMLLLVVLIAEAYVFWRG
jgi:polysaccharide chain length determinant protein (PEP-CTERM system associated)